jgi:hypothetical protein
MTDTRRERGIVRAVVHGHAQAYVRNRHVPECRVVPIGGQLLPIRKQLFGESIDRIAREPLVIRLGLSEKALLRLRIDVSHGGVDGLNGLVLM